MVQMILVLRRMAMAQGDGIITGAPRPAARYAYSAPRNVADHTSPAAENCPVRNFRKG